MQFIKGHENRKRARVRLDFSVGLSTPCWVWLGVLRDGYGILTRNYRKVGAHRYAYERSHGSVPDGYEVHHVCTIRACVNPAHLEAVSTLRHRQQTAWHQPRRLTKLNPELAEYIRSSTKSGVALAQELGVTQAAICKVRRGVTWNTAKGATA